MESHHDNGQRRSARQVLTPLLILTLAGSFACGQDNPGIDESQMETQRGELFATNGTTLWNGATSTTHASYGTRATIPVCFAVRKRVNAAGATMCNQTDATNDCDGIYAKPDPSVPAGGPLVALDQGVLRPFIKQWITQTWSHAAGLEFTGWGDCPIDATTGFHKDSQLANTIVIQFKDGDATSVLGRSSTAPTVVQYNWIWLMVVAKGTQVANLFNLVHEFGHALGFAHEWVRPGYDFPAGCNQNEDAPNQPGFAITPWIDHKSIMDKCQSATGIYGLSPGDIIGVQQAYGRMASGSLVGYNGLCAGPAGGTSALAPIAEAPCRNQPYQLWTRGSATQRFQANIDASTARCLNVSGGILSTTGPTVLASWTCDSPGTNEVFPLSGVEWRGMGNMCVTAGSGAGTGITMKACDGSTAQKWTFLDGDSATSLRFDQIKSVSTSLCLSTLTTAGALGEVPVLRTCSTTDTKQRFTYPGQGIISFGNWCLNVAGGDPSISNAQIGLWNGCTAVPRPFNEQFTLSGNIKSGPLPNGQGQNIQQCLDSTSVTQTTVWTCQPPGTNPQVPQNQIWEYYL